MNGGRSGAVMVISSGSVFDMLSVDCSDIVFGGDDGGAIIGLWRMLVGGILRALILPGPLVLSI